MPEYPQKATLMIKVDAKLKNEMREIQKVLNRVGYKLTFSDLMNETLRKTVEIYRPLIKKIKENKEITKAEIFEIMSKYFSVISEELKYLAEVKNDRYNKI